jgi:RNA recognition motif-containing protein
MTQGSAREPKEQHMGKKLYVGNLPFSATQGELDELFGQVGTVESVNIITDKFSGESRGFGFVEMATDEEAQAAIERLDGQDLKGRALKVNEARPLAERPGRGGGGGGGGGGGRGSSRGGSRDRQW